ncbi:MAG TPA: hypothetical protein VFF13_04065 [archaeon]|nr:hypothetical protein [archaeon]
MTKRGLEHRHFIAVSKRDGLRESLPGVESAAMRKILKQDIRAFGDEAKQLLSIGRRSRSVQAIGRRLKLQKESSVDERKVFAAFVRNLIKNFDGEKYALEHGLMNIDLQRKVIGFEVVANGDLHVFKLIKGNKINRRVFVEDFAQKMFEHELSEIPDLMHAKAQRVFKPRKKKKK